MVAVHCGGVLSSVLLGSWAERHVSFPGWEALEPPQKSDVVWGTPSQRHSIRAPRPS